MKLRKLHIKNIASIEEATIEFDNLPLATADVFLITGNTGAGKSTILDAIALALYGNTPRLSSSQLREAVEQDGESVTQNSPVQLLRRGATEGLVELSFRGNNEVEYEATWHIYRARHRADGKITGPNRYLRKVGSDAEITGIRAVNAEVQQAIGLDFDQYCRTSMLAQGEFSKFLKSPGSEKSAILEKITDTSIYTRIGQKIFEVTKEKRDRWEAACRDIERLQPLTPLEKLKIRREIAALGMEHSVASAATKRDRELLDLLTTTARAEKEIAKQHNRLEKLGESYSYFRLGIKKDESDLSILAKKLEESRNLTESEAPRRLTIDNRGAIKTTLAILGGARDSMARLNEKLEKERTRLREDLLPHQTTMRETCGKSRQHLDHAKEEYEKKQKEVESLGLPGMRESRERDKALESAVKDAAVEIREYTVAAGTLEEDTRKAADTSREIEDLRRRHEALTPRVKAAADASEKAKEIYEGQKDTIDKFARQMRARMHEGCTCPVCRQTVTVLPQPEEELAALIEGYKKDYAEAENTRKKLETEASNLSGQLSALDRQLKREKAKCDEYTRTVSEKKEAVKAGLLALGMTEPGEKASGWTAFLDGMAAEVARRLDLIDTRIKEAEREERTLSTLASAYQNAMKEDKDAVESLGKIEKMISESDQKISSLAETLENTRKDAAEAGKKIEEMVVGEWQTSWQEQPGEFVKELDKAADRLAEAERLRVETERQLAEATERIKAQKENLQTLTGLMPEWEKREDTRPETGKAHPQGGALVAEVSSALQAIATLEARMKEDYGRIEILRKDPSDTPETVSARLEESERRMHSAGTEKGKLENRIETDLRLRRTIVELRSQAETLKKEYDRWGELNEHFGSSDGKKFRNIAQSFVLRNLVETANSHLASLSGRYRLECLPASLNLLVADAFHGDTRRSLNTLSGGETFIVSLALALGLSDIGENLKVETLFIDEGFGTLSGEPLQSVIRTLRALHGYTGRHVGIISHVEELQNEIPIQITVSQNPRSSSSKIRVEG